MIGGVVGKVYKGKDSSGQCLRQLRLVHRQQSEMSPVSIRNVLISDAVDPSCVDLLKANNINVTCKYKLPKADLIADIAVSFTIPVFIRCLQTTLSLYHITLVNSHWRYHLLLQTFFINNTT